MTTTTQATTRENDGRYSVNDNWSDTQDAISDFLAGWTANLDPRDLDSDFSQTRYLSEVQPDQLLEELALSGITEVPFRSIELVRWLDEYDGQPVTVTYASTSF